MAAACDSLITGGIPSGNDWIVDGTASSASSSASANISQFAKRSSARFSMQRSTIATRLAGTFGAMVWSGAARFVACAIRTAGAVSPSNGNLPLSAWYITMPSEYTSLRPSRSAPETCSGLM